MLSPSGAQSQWWGAPWRTSPPPPCPALPCPPCSLGNQGTGLCVPACGELRVVDPARAWEGERLRVEAQSPWVLPLCVQPLGSWVLGMSASPHPHPLRERAKTP